MSSAPDLGPLPQRVTADAEQVRRLIGDQFPQWADLPRRVLDGISSEYATDRHGVR